MKSKLTFRALELSDIPLMHRWFNLPHVQRFYSLHQWTENEVLEKLKPYIFGEKPVWSFIVLTDKNPIGYVQWYKVSDYPWPNQSLPEEVVKNAAGMDLFIGDECQLGKGIGTEIIQAFLESKIWPKFQYCIVDPSIDNLPAIRCYKKLNFQAHAVVKTNDAMGRPTTLKLMMLKR